MARVLGKQQAQAPTTSSGVRIATLREGGSYSIGPDPLKVVRTLRDYAGIPAQEGAQRDHIVPVSLGGTSNADNIAVRSLKEATYRDNIEKYVAKELHNGKLTLPQARNMVLNWKDTEIPGQKAWNSKFGGPSNPVSNFLKGIPGVEFLSSIFKPDQQEQQFEQQTFPTPQNPVERFITAPLRAGAKVFTRVMKPGIEPLGQDIGTSLEYAQRTGKPFNPFDFSQDKEVLGKTGFQVLGDVLQGVLTAYAGGKSESEFIAYKEALKKEAQKGLTAALKFGVKTGTKEGAGLGAGFGAATALSQGTDPNKSFGGNILDILRTAGTATVVGGMLGGATGALSAGASKVSPELVARLKAAHEEVKTPEAKAVVEGVADHLGVDLTSNEPLNPKPEIKQPEVSLPEVKTLQPDLTYQPLEVQTPTKQSKLAQGVEAKAVENKLTQGFGDLPEYQTIDIKNQSARALDLIDNNPEQAIRIALGQERPPEGLLPESVFVAVEDRAIKAGDVATLHDLATNSRLTTEASQMGQRLRTLAERDPESPVAAMQAVVDARKKAMKPDKVATAKTKTINELKDSIKQATPKPKDWNDFVTSITC